MSDIIFKATTRGGRNFIEVTDTGTDTDRYMIKQDGAVDYVNTTREVLAYIVKQSGWKEGTFDKIEIDTDHIGEQYLTILKMINKEFGFLYKSPKGSRERQYYFDIIRFIAQNIKNGTDMAIEDMIWKAKDALERKGIMSSRRPIKSGINDECIGESADGTYSIYKNDFDKLFMFSENGRITKEVDYNDDEVDGVLENWIEIYDIKINPSYKNFIYNSRRPCNSVRNPGRITELRKEWKDNYRNLFGDDYEFDYFNDKDEALRRDDILRKDETANRIRKEFRSLKDDNWDEFRTGNITSARYIATDPESGEVLGSADTYEEAVNEWGEDVTITDSEAAEGQEDMGLFQSRRPIKSAVDGGWEVRSSDVPEALDLFVEYFGEEDALEEIAKAMGNNVLEENIDWIAQQWGFAEELEDKDVWDKYETAKELMGESELFNNLTQAAGYDELAEDLAFIFRMNDFREWDKYDNEDEDNEISDDDKDYCLWDLLYDIYGEDKAQPIEDVIYESGAAFDEIFEEYESEGGGYSERTKYTGPCFDNTELAAKVVNHILQINAIDVDAIEPNESEITNNRSFPIRTVQNIMSGKWSEDYAAECIAQKQDINVGYARQILSSWIEQYKPKLIKSGVLDIAEDINTEFDIDGDLESWAEQYTNNSGKSNTVGGEMVRAAMQIIYRYNNDGDMIGRGYGNETVNAAARYITEKAEMGVNEQIQKWLDHKERADADDYDSFIETFTTEIEQILRENPELFQKPNKDDYWDWKEDEDMNYGLDEVYLDDGNGNQYWFRLSNDRWTCTGIELDPYSVTYQEGDTINEGDEYSDEILSPGEEFGSFEADGFIYEYAGDDWDDDREQYTSWQITSVKPQDPYCDDGETFDFYDLEPDELYGYTLYDHNGNEVDERTFLASSLKVK